MPTIRRQRTMTPTLSLAEPTTQTAALTRRRFFHWPPPVWLGLATAALLYPAYYPVNWGFLGWIALAPMLYLTIRLDARRTWLAAWVGGLAFAVPALQWVRIASTPMYATWVGLALFLSLHFFLFVVLTRMLTLRLRVPLLASAPAVWTALEYLRAHIGIGFAWYYLGHTQHEFIMLVQIADLVGVYGVSFVVMMVNVATLQTVCWIVRRWQANGEAVGVAATLRPRLSATLAVACTAFAASLGYGWWRLSEAEFTPGPRVALVQGNLPQHIHDDSKKKEVVFKHFAQIAYQATDADPLPDLVIWSETSMPFWWNEVSPEMAGEPLPGDWDDLVRDRAVLKDKLLKSWAALPEEAAKRLGYDRLATLYGLNARTLYPDGERLYNTALLIDRRGRPTARYDKIYRVPFGEYIPWEETIPVMRWLSPYEGRYGIEPGDQHTVFELEHAAYSRFAVLICYEDTVPHLPPRYFDPSLVGDRTPDFFVNISNDGWFKGSEEHEQHLATARFRAIETRRALVRAVNMGITCVIDGNGRIVAALPKSKHMDPDDQGRLLIAVVPIDTRSSWYIRGGDWLCWICAAFVAGLATAAIVATIRRRFCDVPAAG